jgi:predicted amidohydrolase YtcJ
MKPAIFYIAMLTLYLSSCSSPKKAGLILYNGVIYTVDSAFSVAQAMAIANGKILATGSNDEIRSQFEADTAVDLEGKVVYPGFIDAHCHFYGYGKNLRRADLKGTRTFDEVLDRLVTHEKKVKAPWLLGRGWDQNDWPEKKFPDRTRLDQLFPDIPVMITRIDGHAALVNAKALQLAGISATTKVKGGSILISHGEPTGILIDNAMNLVTDILPASGPDEIKTSLLEAQSRCFAAGLTTVADAGLLHHVIEVMDQAQQEGKLKMRLYIMLDPADSLFNEYLDKGPRKDSLMHISSVKLYVDGALGSRGGCLLKPYTDDPGNYGLLVETPENLKRICEKAFAKGFQVCTHAIGDSGVRTMLNIYASVLHGKNDKRWRIEHAQVVDPSDFVLFQQYSIIPSVQPTHATSDMEWAGQRLGPVRIKTAYAYKQLLEQNGWLAFGTDFPIEEIYPLYTFYAAVTRKDLAGNPPGGFQPENAVTREQALKAMTIWAAKACFEEEVKGSLETGKYADFVILNQDLLKVPEKDILKTKVLVTYINGEPVFSHNL